MLLAINRYTRNIKQPMEQSHLNLKPTVSAVKLASWMQDEYEVLKHWSSLLKIPLQICATFTELFHSPFSSDEQSAPSNSMAGLKLVLDELAGTEKRLGKLREEIGETLVAPVESFLGEYKERVEATRLSGERIVSEVKRIKDEIETHKGDYWNSKDDLEKLLREEKNSVDAIQDQERRIDDLKSKYANSLKEGNSNIQAQCNEYNKVVSSVLDIEASKVNLLQYSLNKTIEFLKQLAVILQDTTRNLPSCLTYFQVGLELNLIKIECSQEMTEFGLLEFEEHLSERKETKVIYDNYFISTENKSEESMKNLFDRLVGELTKGKELPSEEQSNVMKLLHLEESRTQFAERLMDIKSPLRVESESAFRCLGSLIKYMLTRFADENSRNYSVIAGSLQAAEKVYLQVLLQQRVERREGDGFEHVAEWPQHMERGGNVGEYSEGRNQDCEEQDLVQNGERNRQRSAASHHQLHIEEDYSKLNNAEFEEAGIGGDDREVGEEGEFGRKYHRRTGG